jgi:DnaJ-class molecular chaperone
MSDHPEPKVKKQPWMICERCEGEGTVVHPALSVWTSEDRDEDPDGFEAMMEGQYDVRCPECGGNGKVREPTEEELEDRRERDEMKRTQAMENGDSEAYHNRDIRNFYY